MSQVNKAVPLNKHKGVEPISAAGRCPGRLSGVSRAGAGPVFCKGSKACSHHLCLFKGEFALSNQTYKIKP